LRKVSYEATDVALYDIIIIIIIIIITKIISYSVVKSLYII